MNGHLVLIRYILNELFEAVLDNDIRKQYINLQDRKGRTPMFYAAARGQFFVVRVLGERGVELDSPTNETHAAPGSTAIMASAENGYTACFEYLLYKNSLKSQRIMNLMAN